MEKLNESITALVIGDPHFKESNVKEMEQMTTKIIAIAKEKKPTFVVVLGDTLDTHEMAHIEPLTMTTEFFHPLSLIAPLYILIGNHDRRNNSDFLSKYHPFSALKYWSNTYIADRVLDKTINGYRFLFVPYVYDGRFLEAINTMTQDLSNIKAIFAHQTFHQAKMGGIRSMTGDQWSSDKPFVISGHIHNYDRLQNNIIYIGTPLQHAFGDNSDKTISFFEFNSSKEPKEERIDLGLIKREIVYLDANKLISWEPSTGKLIKVVLRGTSAEIKATMKLDKYTQLSKHPYIKMVTKTISNQTVRPIMIKNIGYLRRLGEIVNNDEQQKKWYNFLFGTIN